MKTPILLVEDDVVFSKMLNRFLERNGYDMIRCYSLEEAEKNLAPAIRMIFTDLRLPGGDGINFLKQVKDIFPNLPMVAMTSYTEVSTTVETIKLGTFDYISKPFQQEDVLDVIKNARSTVFSTPKLETVETAAPLGKTDRSNPVKMVKAPKVTEENPSIGGIGPASKKLSKFISSMAPTDMSVLVMGESGTSEEVVTKLIHLKDERHNRPFIAVDCGAIPKEITSSEFFGHVKGSFTGAVTGKKGHFEETNGGTIFPDEVSSLGYGDQIQLLHALQERRTRLIGSSKEIKIGVRVLAAANKDLLEAVSRGDFREDLYHHLNKFAIKVSSLGGCKDDLMIFASYFLEITNGKLHKDVQGFTGRVVQKILNYSWGGNLRELSNVVKHATLLTTTDYIGGNELSDFVMNETRHFPTERFSFSVKENEHELITEALYEANNNKTEAAKLLGFTRKTLYNKLKVYNIEEF